MHGGRTSRSFKDLQRAWYDRLEQSGFHDIEDVKQESRPLKEWDTNFFRNRFNLVRYETSKKYYEQCIRILNEHEFKNAIHQKIWRLHCEGLSEREITKEISEDKKIYKNGKSKSYKKSMVHNIVSGLASRIKRD